MQQKLRLPRHRTAQKLNAGARDFLRDQTGATAVAVAVAAPALLGISALGIDLGLWYSERRLLQLDADAGAVAAATEKGHNGQPAGDRPKRSGQERRLGPSRTA